MPITLDEPLPGVLDLRATGKLTDEDYRSAVPRLEQVIARHGRLRLLVEMADFQGWDAHAAWDDFQFGVRHNDDIERLAMVGDHAWENWMFSLSRPFIKAEVLYFDRSEIQAARDWLREGLA